jgi:hypothetical protein
VEEHDTIELQLSLAVISLPKSLLDAVRVLEGQPAEDSIRSVVVRRIMSRLRDNQSNANEFARRYGSLRRLRRRILRSPHEWEQEADLFEWEALLTENKELRRILAEAGA